MELKLLYIRKSDHPEKKWTAVFEVDGKKVRKRFGQAGADDRTLNASKQTRNAYRKRHIKAGDVNNPITPAALSYHILWNTEDMDFNVVPSRSDLICNRKIMFNIYFISYFYHIFKRIITSVVSFSKLTLFISNHNYPRRSRVSFCFNIFQPYMFMVIFTPTTLIYCVQNHLPTLIRNIVIRPISIYMINLILPSTFSINASATKR